MIECNTVILIVSLVMTQVAGVNAVSKKNLHTKKKTSTKVRTCVNIMAISDVVCMYGVLSDIRCDTLMIQWYTRYIALCIMIYRSTHCIFLFFLQRACKRRQLFVQIQPNGQQISSVILCPSKSMCVDAITSSRCSLNTSPNTVYSQSLLLRTYTNTAMSHI